MLVLCCIIGFAMAVVAIVSLLNGAKVFDVLAGGMCMGFFWLIPFLILMVSRYHSRGKKRRTDIVTGQNAFSHGHVSVEIQAGERLPEICVCCGAGTKKVSKFQFGDAYTKSDRYDWSRVHPLLMIFLIWQYAFVVIGAKLIGFFERWIDQKKYQKNRVEFRIPHCRQCVRQHPIVQRSFDFHGRRMGIAAPAAFAKTLAEMRKAAKA